MYQNGLGDISDTYPNPYLPVTVPPLIIILMFLVGKENSIEHRDFVKVFCAEPFQGLHGSMAVGIPIEHIMWLSH